MRKYLIALVATVLVGTTLTVGAPASATRDTYIPPSGATFNNPHGSNAEVRAIIRHLNRTIDSVPKGGKIRIASWNVRSHNIGAALIRAHRRGVSVQVIMDRHNWRPENPNIDIQRVAQAFKGPMNRNRPVGMKSWVNRCRGSCRGPSGIAHSKFFIFDKVRGPKKKNGKHRMARNVVMYGSYNATELGATIQWNDLFTFKGQKKRYQLFQRMFNQMRRDQPVKQGFVRHQAPIATHFYPYTGNRTKVDPVMKVLNRVRCRGAGTPNGRTRIRIAQTAMHGERGLRLARKLVALQNQGCDIRIAYAMFGTRVVGMLREAGIPLRHLAYDRNGDGIYDEYLHSKAMTIVGHYGGKRMNRFTLNGSANWTLTGLRSDEVVGLIRRPGFTKRYTRWINSLINTHPPHWTTTSAGRMGVAGGAARDDQPEVDHLEVERRLRERGIDPYALIKQEM